MTEENINQPNAREENRKSIMVFAMENSLEEFLEKPRVLNQKIIKMLHLQNMSQGEVERSSELGGRQKSYLKLYAQGKFTLNYPLVGAHDQAAREAFDRAAEVWAMVDESRFHTIMAEKGVPVAEIKKYLDGYSINDDTYTSLRSHWSSE